MSHFSLVSTTMAMTKMATTTSETKRAFHDAAILADPSLDDMSSVLTWRSVKCVSIWVIVVPSFDREDPEDQEISKWFQERVQRNDLLACTTPPTRSHVRRERKNVNPMCLISIARPRTRSLDRHLRDVYHFRLTVRCYDRVGCSYRSIDR